MSPDVQFAATLFADTPVIAGAWLRPLTLGHALLLTRLESPLMPGNDRDVTIADLALALEVCRRPWPAAVGAMQRGRRARAWLAWRALRLHWLDAEQVLAATRDFLAWLQGQWRGPNTFSEPSDGTGSDAPVLASLLAACMAELNLSEAGALALPVVRAQWLLALQGERQGLCKIMGQGYADVFAQARAMEAEWRKQNDQGPMSKDQTPPV